MTATAIQPANPDLDTRSRVAWMVADAVAVTGRNVLALVRIPQSLFFATIQPIMFTLLFRYSFRGAVATNVAYVDYLMPGIFVQTVLIVTVGTAIGLADDKQKGLVERFRSLPMAPSALLAGRTNADTCRNVFTVVLMVTVGFLVGFRIHTNPVALVAGLGLALLFAYAASWGFAIIGLRASNAETAQLMAFPILFPLVFASSAFVPVDTMPGWLQAFAKHQPVSVTINAVRALVLGGPTADLVVKSLAWSLGTLVVLAPLAVRTYRRTT
jgi:ABC transporter DrrB family efflux protein